MKRFFSEVNLLAILAAVLMITAMFFPWWNFRLEWTEWSSIYPYRIVGPGSELVGYERSPQMTLLTGLLVACIVAFIVSAFSTRRWARGSLLVFGILALLGTWRLLARVTGVAARFGIPVHGHGRAAYEIFTVIEVYTAIMPGMVLGALSGVCALAAGLFARKISLSLIHSASQPNPDLQVEENPV